ncbi:hypothetical protein IWZ03DRAFT_375843 [Phyllosticta citriasiana]|uniref:Secreted protein n=1 Tax=Phyllosticta citriasiana TaxID=595635 RepID=A0ABR1KR94_9PEZI
MPILLHSTALCVVLVTCSSKSRCFKVPQQPRKLGKRRPARLHDDRPRTAPCSQTQRPCHGHPFLPTQVVYSSRDRLSLSPAPAPAYRSIGPFQQRPTLADDCSLNAAMVGITVPSTLQNWTIRYVRDLGRLRNFNY